MKPSRSLGFDRFSGLYLWAALIAVFSLWEVQFRTLATAHTVAGERSISAILGLAIIIPLACGAFDLSVGAVANFATINAVIFINDGVSWPVAALLAVLISVGIGIGNGFFVVRLHVSSFITTLGIGSVITALQVVVTNNLQPVQPPSHGWANFTNRPVFGFQIVFVYMLILAVILWWVLQHTPVGRYLYAIGSNPDAARLSGVSVNGFTWISLIASATIAGIGGVMFGSLTGPSLTYGAGLLLPAFAAAFLGSTQIVPGRFNVWGTVMSIFVLATGVQGLQLAYPNAQWLDPLFSGAALVLAVAIAVGRQRTGEERTRKRLSRRGGGGDQVAVEVAHPANPGDHERAPGAIAIPAQHSHIDDTEGARS
ncbi:MAG: ABC transporter permease [Acidimicrobiales bacterium]